MYASEQFYSTLEETFNGASKRLDVKVVENENEQWRAEEGAPAPGIQLEGASERSRNFCV